MSYFAPWWTGMSLLVCTRNVGNDTSRVQHGMSNDNPESVWLRLVRQARCVLPPKIQGPTA